MADEFGQNQDTGQAGNTGVEGQSGQTQDTGQQQYPQYSQQQDQRQDQQQQQQPEYGIKDPNFDRYTGRFEYSKIYYFRYTPIDLNKIHIYDQYPQVIFMDIRGVTALGINLHWIPGALRPKFVAVINEMKKKAINESLFRLWYRTVKYNPPLQFAMRAIRRYYISHCTNIKVVGVWETIRYTQALYRARFLKRSAYNPAAHIVQRGARERP